MPIPPKSAQKSKPFAYTRKSISDTIEDIRAVVTRYGGTSFLYTVRDEGVGIEFTYDQLLYRFWQALPAEDAQEAARRWRIFYDRTRSTLVAVSEGLVEMSEAFLANVIVPETGETIYRYFGGKLVEFQQQRTLPPGQKDLP